MAEDDNKALIARIAVEIWNHGDLEAVNDVMGADGRIYGPHMPDGEGGREHWRHTIAMYRRAFPDVRVVYEELICTGDTVVGRWSVTGTQRGALPGLPATGRSVALSGITIYRVVDGKVLEAWEQIDLLSMWKQLGVVNLPERDAPAARSLDL